MDIDDPHTTALRLQIIRSKPHLRKLYEEWHRDIATHFPSDARVLELGSGAGFPKEFIPQLSTSELFSAPGVERIIDAQAIAMADASLDGIVLILQRSFGRRVSERALVCLSGRGIGNH